MWVSTQEGGKWARSPIGGSPQELALQSSDVDEHRCHRTHLMRLGRATRCGDGRDRRFWALSTLAKRLGVNPHGRVEIDGGWSTCDPPPPPRSAGSPFRTEHARLGTNKSGVPPAGAGTTPLRVPSRSRRPARTLKLGVLHKAPVALLPQA